MRLRSVVLCIVCTLSYFACAEDAAAPPKPAASDPKAVSAAPAPIKAEAGCSHCTYKVTAVCMPAIKVDGVVYIVTLSDKASESTRKLVESLPKLEGGAKAVKLVGRPLTVDEAAKQPALAKAEHKFYYEIGEMSLQE